MVVWPLIVFLVFLVKLGSDGGGFFIQHRVGRKKKLFNCLKVRTMVQGTRQLGTHDVSETSITTIGHFLRGSKLDELPQLFNVLKGDMSLVGPRPCLPVQHQLVSVRARTGIFEVRPGITGLAQILGIDMSEPQLLVKYDNLYLSRQSLHLDAYILFLTFVPKSSALYKRFCRSFKME